MSLNSQQIRKCYFYSEIKDGKLNVHIELPGIEKEEIVLQNKGQKILVETKRSNSRFNFADAIEISKAWDTSNPKASLKNGVLTLIFKESHSNINVIEIE